MNSKDLTKNDRLHESRNGFQTSRTIELQAIAHAHDRSIKRLRITEEPIFWDIKKIKKKEHAEHDDEANVGKSECSLDISKMSDLKAHSDTKRMFIKTNYGAKMMRIVESAVRYFDEKDKKKDNVIPESLEDDNEIEEEDRNVDFEEYCALKQELQDVKNELAIKDSTILDQKKIIQKMEIDLRFLTSKVQYPQEVTNYIYIDRLRNNIKVWLQN